MVTRAIDIVVSLKFAQCVVQRSLFPASSAKVCVMRNDPRHRVAHEIDKTHRWDKCLYSSRNMRNFGELRVARRRLTPNCRGRGKLPTIPIRASCPVAIEAEEVQFFLSGHRDLRMSIEVVVHARRSALHRADDDEVGQRHRFPPLTFSSGSPRMASRGSRGQPPRFGRTEGYSRTRGDETG